MVFARRRESGLRGGAGRTILADMTRFIHLRRLWRFQGPLLVLIGVIMLVFAAQMAMDETAFDGMMVVPAEVTAAWNALRNGNPGGAGELATLIGHAFLHAGLDHLLGNMLFLWIFAALASELLGARWMLAVFVITAACGGICHVGLNADEAIPMLGASGAVMGFEGLYLAMAVRWHLPDPHVWPMSSPIPPVRLAMLGVLGLALDFMGFMGGTLGVAYGAHLGGFIGGMILGGVVVPMPRVARPR
jgi:membrane associated rhomboid family serine protease